MSEQPASNTHAQTEPDLVGTLVRSAGARTNPDPERFERARAAMQADWHSVINRRRSVQRLRIAAVLAVIAISAGLVKTYWRTAPPIITVATVDRVVGDVVVRHVKDGQLQVAPLRAGQTLVAGNELDTAVRGRALLSWVNGAQLRLDQHSLVELKSTHELQLTRGAVYIETHNSSAGQISQLSVTTPFGTVRHIGTSFEVRVADGSAHVQVREGLVSFSESGRTPVKVAAGQQLTAASGSIHLGPGPGTADTAWSWLHEIAPRFTIEGRSLFDTLEWLGHEGGLRILYRNEDARSQARAVILRGNIEGLDTRKALIAVLTGSGLEFNVRDDRVEIQVTEPL